MLIRVIISTTDKAVTQRCLPKTKKNIKANVKIVAYGSIVLGKDVRSDETFY